MKFKLFARLRDGKPHAKRSSYAQKEVMDAKQQITPSSKPTPFEEVATLVSAGVSEAEIIQALKEEGYSFKEIDDALNATLKTTVTGEAPQLSFAPETQPTEPGANDKELFGRNFTEEQEFEGAQDDLAPANIPTQSEEDTARETAETDEYNRRIEEVEEIISAIIEEKIGRVEDAKKELEGKLDNILKEFQAIKQQTQKEKEQTANIEGKEEEDISRINAKLDDLEPRLVSLEKAFKDIIPNLIDSVRDIKERMTNVQADTLDREYIKEPPIEHKIKPKEIIKEEKKHEKKEKHTKYRPSDDKEDLFENPE